MLLSSAESHYNQRHLWLGLKEKSMNIDQLRTVYDTYQRMQDVDPMAERNEQPERIRYYLPAMNFGFVLYSNLTDENADRTIADCIAYYRQKGCDFEWKYFDYDSPTDLPERLVIHGLQPDDVEAVMVLEIKNAPARLLDISHVDIRHAITAEQLQHADAIQEAVWGDNPRQKVSERILDMWDTDPDSVSLHIAYIDNQPVSFGRVEFSHGDNPFASIWSGSTLPDYRRQGIYTAVVASRLQEAQQRQYHYLTVDAKPDTSMPILSKLGFVTIAYSTPYNWSVNE